MNRLSDGGAAPFLGGDIRERFGERPLVARWVLGRVLPLTVFEICRLHDDLRAVRSGALAVGARAVHTNHHRMRDLAGPRRPAVVAHVADDRRSLANAQLRAVVLADPDALGEP